ncbi:MAG: hypothetical protein QMD09_14820, partial [Desulfatibacillaceae bacterium]|nr:hypothetical protein [Desulfatibacillaceae bacterium]
RPGSPRKPCPRFPGTALYAWPPQAGVCGVVLRRAGTRCTKSTPRPCPARTPCIRTTWSSQGLLWLMGKCLQKS